MKSFQMFSLSLLAATVVLSCSNGNSRLVPGRRCAENYVSPAINFDGKAAAQKTWQKGDSESQIPAGTYSYVGSDLVFTQNAEKGAIVEIRDAADKAGNFKASVFCVRNGLRLDQDNLSLAAATATKMISAANTVSGVEARELSFRLEDRRLIADAKPLAKPESLTKTYEGKATEFFLFDAGKNNTDYEILSRYSDGTGTYVMVTRLRRTDTPAAVTAAAKN